MALWIEPGRTTEVAIEGTVFLVRVLTAREQARIADLAASGGISTAACFEVLRMGLAGWTGDGAPPFTRDENGYVKEESLDRLSVSAWSEIAQAIVRVNQLSDTDRGNSSPSSPPASTT